MPIYSLAELAALTGLPPRTIRYYVAEGLIPSPGREGPGTRYPESTLARLRLIARLRDAHQPLAEIKSRLKALGEDELVALLAEPSPEPPSDSAIDYIRGVLGERTRGTAPGISSPMMASPLTPAQAPMAMAFLAQAPEPAQTPQPAQTPRPAAPSNPAVPLSIAPISTPAVLSSPTAASNPEASQAFDRSQWDRISLAEGIELHVRRPMSRRDNRMVDRLVAFARQLQGEDPL
jgi:DNA-binding transcriptional MerR regulator